MPAATTGKCIDDHCICRESKVRHCAACGELTILTRPTLRVLFTEHGKEIIRGEEAYCGCQEIEVQAWPR